MRRSIAIAGIASSIGAALIALGWYVASPFYAVANLRNAAIRADTKELSDRVDFPRLRDEMRAQISQLFVGKMAESLRGNPFAALGAAFATKLTDVMIDAMVTPAGIAAIVSPTKDSKPEAVSGWHLMFSSDFKVHREGINSFEFGSVREENTPTLRFDRQGLTWRLVSLQFPKELLARQMGSAKGDGPLSDPYMPKWELTERKDPMDDTVTTALTRGADQEVSTRFSSVRPVLVLRCRSNRFDAYINVKSSVDYDYQTYSASIRLRFDDNPAIRANWNVSDDREALFVPNPVSFVGNLLKTTLMQFEWKGSGGGPSVARFSRGDLEMYTKKFADACGKRELFDASQVASVSPQLSNPAAVATPSALQYMVPAGAYVDPAGVIAALVSAKVPYYVEPVRTGDGTVNRLRAGPFASREAAEAARTRLIEIGVRPGEVAEIPR